MPATPIYALPYPAAADPADVPLDLQELAERVEAVLGAVPASTLPASPTNGQIAFLDCGNGVIWQFRYNAASGSAYKWEFVGGPPMWAEDVATSTASTTYAATPVGPTITLPRAGDYQIDIGFGGVINVNSASGWMSYDIGGTGAVDADGVETYSGGSTGGTGFSARASNHRSKLKTGLSAVALAAKYKVGSGTLTIERRWMSVIPRRVS